MTKRLIVCKYCGEVFEVGDTRELQVCPGCHSKLIVGDKEE